MAVVIRWFVEVAFIGRAGPPVPLIVYAPTAPEALGAVRSGVREVLLISEPPGGSAYTVSVYAPGCRAGDPSVAAETVTLITA
ncbi:hypothetical protein ACFQ6C_25870 [Streptomyces sp. NPDC056454]|uniref:hypothetical protein n=1 Tax=Streptomyces sp. NPDC056454 TaxID=3345823 RepID=UPI00367719E4